MDHFLYFLVIVFLLIAGIEDIRHRSIRWIWVPLIAVASFLLAARLQGAFASPLSNLMFNGIITMVLLLLLKAYFILKTGDVRAKLLDQKIGKGDVFVMLAITPLFDPFVFVLFLNVTLLVTLGGHLLSIYLYPAHSRFIPLVGYLNGMLIAILLSDHIFLDHMLTVNPKNLHWWTM